VINAHKKTGNKALVTNYTVSQKKRHPFYICYNLIRCHPISSILGRNILQEISFRVFILYRVKSSNDFYGIQ